METERKYSIEQYSKNWARRFHAQEKLLRSVLGKDIIEVHHVGSTAIPNMSAKPIADILVIVKNLKLTDRAKKKLKTLGYGLRVNYVVPNSRLLEKFKGNIKLYNIHLLSQSHVESRRLLNVKNYLIAHPAETKRYGELKKQIYEKTKNYALYKKGKTNFLNALERKAIIWTNNK
jgi:GrpB-like predicted nucleotidyltransferase (UPF0157 family)